VAAPKQAKKAPRARSAAAGIPESDRRPTPEKTRGASKRAVDLSAQGGAKTSKGAGAQERSEVADRPGEHAPKKVRAGEGAARSGKKAPSAAADRSGSRRRGSPKDDDVVEQGRARTATDGEERGASAKKSGAPGKTARDDGPRGRGKGTGDEGGKDGKKPAAGRGKGAGDESGKKPTAGRGKGAGDESGKKPTAGRGKGAADARAKGGTKTPNLGEDDPDAREDDEAQVSRRGSKGGAARARGEQPPGAEEPPKARAERAPDASRMGRKTSKAPRPDEGARETLAKKPLRKRSAGKSSVRGADAAPVEEGQAAEDGPEPSVDGQPTAAMPPLPDLPDPPDVEGLREYLRVFAGTLPGAAEDEPWGEVAFKAAGRVFLFLGPFEPETAKFSFSVRLPRSGSEVLAKDFARPTGYGLGRSGWITFTMVEGRALPPRVLTAWIFESFSAADLPSSSP